MKNYNGDGSRIEAAPQVKIPIAASVEIHLLANGQIMARTTGNRLQFNMMMTTAMQDLAAQLKEQEKEQAKKIVEAPPGIDCLKTD